VLEQFLNHISRYQLCKTTDKILLAVSGGVDSMVMAHLFREAGFQIGVAHCNFQLRGEDSKADEALVNLFCIEKKIPFHLQRFDTNAFAEESGLSIQLAARELRYKFFKEVREENGYDSIATAHHLNDSLETVLLNLTKGTGIKGLAGIPVRNEFIIRPLLFASRDEILDYASLHRIHWREDKSNTENDYQRNFLRNKVIPLLEEINPNLSETFRSTAERISGAVSMTEEFLSNFKSNSVRSFDDEEQIDLNALKKYSFSQVLLWELIKSKGFNYDQCCDIVRQHQTGKQFFSTGHRLVIDRDVLIIRSVKVEEILERLINAGDKSASNGSEILLIDQNTDSKIQIDKDPLIAQLDASTISFPLRWRKWEAGDFFQPLGMQSKKKLSDFFIDLKIPVSQKEKITVLESSGRIVWVVGYRISDDCKITPSTRSSVRIKVGKSG
jgi:tRNA(Ile)-lysidine synthase